jgi:glucuronoarabinoxylan endo-1,4-beta-xylanase
MNQMKRNGMLRKIFLALMVGMASMAEAQQSATARFDAGVTHQRITGFGAFVCSPQFQYNHMSTTDIQKVWGKSSTVGCNIMRIYIPIGRSSWYQSLETAKKAKQMGLIVFASPWGQPAEWKTNNSIDAETSAGVKGSLKRENWPDYAQYLEDYVQYLRQNGVELDAISIQNEPDWNAKYAGCLWSAGEIAEFVKLYGRSISCKIMAPETLAVSDGYVNALNTDDVINCFDIYGGHQYGGIQSAYKNLAKKGKEIWMTEYLINWNENAATKRNFNFSSDFFNFFRAINTCMVGDFNAWIHYAGKRFYGPLGDGEYGTSSGVVTKRGYVMAHFARFVTGMTRIDATFSGGSLEGSAYLSQTGDTVVAVMANTGTEAVDLTMDLPFYTKGGKMCRTSKTSSLTNTTLRYDEDVCRPVVRIVAQSVNTVLFVRSKDRQQSDMKGTSTRFDRLDDQSVTKTGFGTAYKISNKTKTFDHSNPLISSRTTASYGYVALGDRYNQLVMEVKKVSSTLNYTSALTTLTYVNKNGKVSTHDYGELDLNRRENFSLVLDLSPATLTDGCIGLISLTNNNWSSTLSITFGNVYLGTNYSATLTGAYVADDSYVLDYTTDPTCTSLDFKGVTNLPETFPWLEGTNKVVYVADGTTLAGANVVTGSTCQTLQLSEEGGDFRPATAFTAESASATFTLNGMRLLMLPFDAAVPEGVTAYTLNANLEAESAETIQAHQPVLVQGEGTFTFVGSGDVSWAASPLTDLLRGTYAQTSLNAGDYVLAQSEGLWGLQRLTQTSSLAPFGVYAQPEMTDDFLPISFTATGITATPADGKPTGKWFNLNGQQVAHPTRGIYIREGKKVFVK